MDHFQWIVALTRIMSAVFRKGGDCTFLVEELKAVFDPRGGYLKKGGVYMPSIVAEIGAVLERHLIAIGMLEGHALDETQLKYLAEKRAAYEASQGAVAVEPGEGFPAGAQLCNKCNTQAVVQMDGCATCLNCGNPSVVDPVSLIREPASSGPLYQGNRMKRTVLVHTIKTQAL